MATVKLDGVRKVYDDGFAAVRGVTVQVDDGEFLVLVGPSGCGKSTTLRMIAGLETVSEGAIYIDDQIVNDVPPKDRDVAMVFQNYALYPHLNVFDNMAFGLKLRKYPRADIESRVRNAAETLGISAVLDRRPGQLSGGQRQRAALGRAIVRKPRVFLFDEPLSNLDAQLRVQMRTEIARLHRRLGSTMVYVTHDQVEAMTVGDRIAVLKDGQLQQVDTPMNLYDAPANTFVAGFIGSPPMNLISGRIVREEGLHFRANSGTLDLPLMPMQADLLCDYIGREIILGIRPEHLCMAANPLVGQPTAEADLRLDLIEPVGHEVFLHTRSGEDALVCRAAPQPFPLPGASIRLGFDIRRLHFFDPATGDAARGPFIRT